MSDDRFGVPPGWHPDPLGLPQLRWWNGEGWTEKVSTGADISPLLLPGPKVTDRPVTP